MQCPPIKVIEALCRCDAMPRIKITAYLPAIFNQYELPLWYPERIQMDRNQVPLDLYPLTEREQHVMLLYGTDFRRQFIAHLRRSRSEGREIGAFEMASFPDPGLWGDATDSEEDQQLAMRLKWRDILSHSNARP